jgi:glycosyltransferase involved in cell wall biosynthesis
LLKPKIVIFIDWFLPAYKAGGPVKSIANLVALLKQDAEFFIITGDRDEGEIIPLNTVALNKWHSIDGIKVIYLSKEKQTIDEYTAILKTINPNLIYINGLFSENFSIKPLLVSNKLKLRTIIAPRGMLGAGALSIKPLKKKVFLYLSNYLKFYKNVVWHATDQTEKNEINQYIKNCGEVFVIPNVPVKPRLNMLDTKIKNENKLKLVYISRISKKKNLKFILELLNNENTLHNIELDIWGPIEDKVYFEICHKLIEFINNKNVNKVSYKGDLVWNEIESCIMKYDFFILPTLHENFGHAIFESLAAGVPIIISDNTPWRDLQSNKIGWDVNLNIREDWIKVLFTALNMKDEEYKLYAKNCINFANNWVNNQNLLDRYSELFNLKNEA